MNVHEVRLRVLGSDAHTVIVGGPPGLIATAVDRIEELEARWSRFRPDSEISQLNRQAGEWVTVSPETVDLVQRGIEAWYITGTSFDPTVLGSVIRAGYDRSFDEVTSETVAAAHSSLSAGCCDIEIDGLSIRLPAGVGFDPGGIGKGLAADLVVDEIRSLGADGVCVNLGGDLRVDGLGPDGGVWTVALEHPLVNEPLAVIGLAAGAVGTSTTLRRRWESAGGMRHHLIDPATGLPSTSGTQFVSVVAAHGWVAEVLAKAILLRGPIHPFDLIGGTGAEAIVVTDDGRILTSDGFSSFLGEAPLSSSLDALVGVRR